MTNIILLNNKIKASGLKKKFIAEKLGLTYQGLQLKTKGLTELTSSEIAKLCDILNITSLKEKENIFFAKEVDK